MHLRDDYVTMDMGDGVIAAVPVGDSDFHGMLKLNGTAAAILDLIGEGTTPEEVHQRLRERYPEASDQEIAENLVSVLNTLSREGLLIAP